MKYTLGILMAVTIPLPALAQVGHLPERSPYRDLEFKQEWTVFGGHYFATPDPLDVVPQSGAMVGGRWDWRIGGPAYLYGRMAKASLDRRILDAKKPVGERFVGTETVPLLFTDVGFGINLTGFRTWHGLSPQVAFGLGTTADLRGRSDVSKYRFGIPFTLTFGGGVKWTSSGRWQLRADWSNYMYQIKYPESYFLRTGDDDPILLPGARSSMWRRNRAIQIGISYLYHE